MSKCTGIITLVISLMPLGDTSLIAQHSVNAHTSQQWICDFSTSPGFHLSRRRPAFGHHGGGIHFGSGVPVADWNCFQPPWLVQSQPYIFPPPNFVASNPFLAGAWWLPQPTFAPPAFANQVFIPPRALGYHVPNLAPFRQPIAAPLNRPPRVVDQRPQILEPNVAVPGLVDADPPFNQLDEIRQRVARLKISTIAGRQSADRLMSAGDQAFADQIFARATSNYRKAIARAPDYSPPHFRLGHAYVATSQYNLALKSFLTALELAGTSRRDGFSLAEMYRGNQISQELHFENLSIAAQREPNDGGLQFLIGITLYYSGNPLKAREHFRSAAEREGPQQAYVSLFLPAVEIAEPNE